ncbi:MAG TPA: peptidoglycan DD-metalloendopeptidase family protein [bacterium]|nr:peptidoglycan DD-metalloendopeptidase family protein [bacterium]
MRPLGLALLALAWMAAPPARADDAPATRSEVVQRYSSARQELRSKTKAGKKAKQKVRQDERQIQALQSKLDELNRRLTTAQRERMVHVRNLGLVEDKLRSVHSKLELLQGEESADHDALAADLVRLYKARQHGSAALLFSAHSPAEVAARARYLEDLSGMTQRRVVALRESISVDESYRREYHEQEALFAQRKTDAESARRQVELERRQKEAALRSVQSRKAEDQKVAQTLEADAQGLQGLMDGLRKQEQDYARQQQSQASAGGSPRVSRLGGRSSLRGRLPWPVQGRIVSRFGRQEHPQFHTPVFNRGIEIAAAFGSEVRAVAAGKVLHAGEMEGFGQLVVLDHGGGMMSVYGYGSALHVEARQMVAQGDLLMDVGEAATSRQPSLYFEISQGAKAQDPLKYLGRR